MGLILLLSVLFLLFGGGGYWFGKRGDGSYGPHFGLGGILLVLLICWMLGVFGPGPHFYR